MGYSARYHALSLVAVFLALGVGILIGVGFGDSLVSDAQRNIEESLQDDLATAREERTEARSELRREREFSRAAFPALVEDRLAEERIGVIAFGGLSASLGEDIREAIAPSGASVAVVGVVREPLPLGEIAEAVAGRFGLEDFEGDPEDLRAFGERLGRAVVRGGSLADDVRGVLFSRLSGEFGGLSAVVVAHERSEEVDREDREALDRLERETIRGIEDIGIPVVAVERSDVEDSAMGFFSDLPVSTVDNLESFAGRTALVLALAGAEGRFGTGEEATRLLPDLLVDIGRSGGDGPDGEIDQP